MSTITAVIVCRNDNYGGNLTHRAHHSLTTLCNQFDEVIYVDWKSPGGASLLDNNTLLPSNLKHIKITKEFLENNLPQYIDYAIVESIGRNVGVRRATGDWILSTNIDVLVNRPDLNSLDQNTLYTGRRYNVPIEEHLNIRNPLKLFTYCKENKHRFSAARDASKGNESFNDPGDFYSLVVCCGDFQLAHKSLWNKMQGFEEECAGRSYADSNLMKKGFLHGKISLLEPLDLFHLNHGTESSKQPGEILPLNDQQKFVANFTQTTNTENWGLAQHNL